METPNCFPLPFFCWMGITRDKMFKRKITGAMNLPWHKKKQYAQGRPSSHTKLHVIKASHTAQKQLEPRKVKFVRVRGGNRKFRALRLHQGNFTWAGVNFSAKTTIKSVCYNSTSNELVRTNTLVKSCIVYIDPAPFKQFLDVGMA